MKSEIKIFLCALLLVAPIDAATDTPAPTFDSAAAERFARLALACVAQGVSEQDRHVLNSDADVAPPRKLTPAFYGCYDWHSSVHGHWLLARLARTFPDAPFVEAAREALGRDLTAENLKQEAAYLRGEGSNQFRAAVWIRLAAPALRRIARVGRSASGGDVGELASAGGGGNRATDGVAARSFRIRCGSESTIRRHSRSA